MTEPGGASDALAGADGTQLPDPMPVFPDALTAPTVSGDASGFEPTGMPALPDEQAIREAVAAALGEEQDGRATPPGPAGSSPGGSGRAGGGGQRPASRPAQAPQRAAVAPARSPAGGPSGAYQPVAPADLRRRVGRDTGPGSLPTGWKPGGCVIALVVIGLIVFSFLAGFVESLARLLQ